MVSAVRKGINEWRKTVARKLISSEVDSISPDSQSLPTPQFSRRRDAMFKIFRKNCCGLDVHKTWIYACIGITDANSRTEYFQARFSSFSKGLQELALWLDKYGCKEVCIQTCALHTRWLSCCPSHSLCLQISYGVTSLIAFAPSWLYSCG